MSVPTTTLHYPPNYPVNGGVLKQSGEGPRVESNYQSGEVSGPPVTCMINGFDTGPPIVTPPHSILSVVVV